MVACGDDPTPLPTEAPKLVVAETPDACDGPTRQLMYTYISKYYPPGVPERSARGKWTAFLDALGPHPASAASQVASHPKMSMFIDHVQASVVEGNIADPPDAETAAEAVTFMVNTALMCGGFAGIEVPDGVNVANRDVVVKVILKDVTTLVRPASQNYATEIPAGFFIDNVVMVASLLPENE